MREALLATATFRSVELVPLSVAIGDLVDVHRHAYRAYRSALRRSGDHLPDDLSPT